MYCVEQEWGTAGNPTAVRSLAADWKLDCLYCGWGDHNTAWHEMQEARSA